ncbi:MAG: hypothetical protein ACQEQE_10835 [Bacillota bacterium]
METLYNDEEYQVIVNKMNLTNKKLNRKQVFKLYEIACSKTDHLENVNVYDYVKATLNYVEEKAPSSFYGYLKKALENDYANTISVLKLLGRR